MTFNFGDGSNNPFEQFSQMFGLGQADPWDNAAKVATQIASGNGTEGNVDPISRSLVDDLKRVAELQVDTAPTPMAPTKVEVKVVTRTEWSSQSFEVYRPFFERFGEAIGSLATEQTDPSDPTAQMMSQLIGSIGPMMVATSAGSMIGHLALDTLGQYDLPVPRRKGNTVLLVPSNLDDFAADLKARKDEVYLWVLIKELLTQSVFSVEHVSDRVESLFIDFASAFSPNTQLIEQQFGSMESLEDLNSIDASFQSPDAVLSMMRSPMHDLLVPQISALIAPILGFVDYTMDQICNGLIPSHTEIQGAVNDRRNEENEADRFMASLLGIDLSGNLSSLGKSFIEGVVERAGQEGLDRLWNDELDLPTAAEVAAPGLWLERIGLGTEGLDMFEIPDDLSGLDEPEGPTDD